MHIRVITPITTHGYSPLDGFREYVDAATVLSQVELDHGPASIECEFDEMLAAPATVARAIAAEREGVDAVVIDCMGDPGLQAAREAVQILVLGPCEACMHVAAMMGQAFSVLTVLDTTSPGFVKRARVYGVADRLASVRSVNIPVLSLKGDHSPVLAALTEQAVQVVRDDGAHVIIFGCTGMKGLAGALGAELAAQGYGGVPVIDPMPTTLRMAEAFAKVGIQHSRRTYHTPPRKRIDGYSFLGL
ncbi:MAG: hydrogenase expression protein HupH [Chloroflexaceae bacterium]|nr:hydrogenase expression protein HupH [Chloroflexaceae bacterium]